MEGLFADIEHESPKPDTLKRSDSVEEKMEGLYADIDHTLPKHHKRPDPVLETLYTKVEPSVDGPRY